MPGQEEIGTNGHTAGAVQKSENYFSTDFDEKPPERLWDFYPIQQLSGQLALCIKISQNNVFLFLAWVASRFQLISENCYLSESYF